MKQMKIMKQIMVFSKIETVREKFKFSKQAFKV